MFSLLSLLLLPAYLGAEFSVSEYNDGRVLWSDPEDPVLASHIPEGWTLSQEGDTCRDLEPNCADFANRSHCTTNPLGMLTKCRDSCSSIYSGTPEYLLPEEILDHGGIKDFITDAFGFHVGLCSLAEGFDDKQRFTYVTFYREMMQQVSYVPEFTETGFEKMKIPEELFLGILEARDEALAAGNVTVEDIDAGVINTQAVVENKDQESQLLEVHRSHLIELKDDIKEKIFKSLGPLAETWAGVKLLPTSVFGIRRYGNRSALISHLDKPWSHVISAILNIGQEVEEDWPLFIKDHVGGSHRLVLQPGEMLWYESARLVHGRQWPMLGWSYDNIFLHYRPRGAWYEEGKTRGEVVPITTEYIRHKQRRMAATNWEEAWKQYTHYKDNEHLKAANAGGWSIGTDPSNKEVGTIEEFRHIS